MSCNTCGYPDFRPEGHAPWCGRVRLALQEEERIEDLRAAAEAERAAFATT